MAAEHILAVMPSGVAAICQERFDEFCPAGDAIDVAEKAAAYLLPQIIRDQSQAFCCLETGEGVMIWLKSRLRERGVLRALAPERFTADGLLSPGTPESLAAACNFGWNDETRFNQISAQPYIPKLGYARSRISRSILSNLSPIDRVASRVAHFEDRTPCPYCRRWHRNGNALRLHVIENHGAEVLNAMA